MKILELAEQLKAVYDQQGNIEVFFRDPNSNQGPFEVGQVAQCEAEEDEFPESSDE